MNIDIKLYLLFLLNILMTIEKLVPRGFYYLFQINIFSFIWKYKIIDINVYILIIYLDKT